MIQLLLLIVIVGLIVAHLLRSLTDAVTEHFIPVATNKTTLSTGCSAGPDGPHPPPYEAPTDDDPRDLPWIASWSAADKAARRGQNCQVLYTEAGPDGTTIQTVSPSCEAGMAHTRPGDRIVIPESIHLATRAETVQHELIHIHQRRDPAQWYDFYRRSWAFVVQKEPPTGLPAAVTAARRSNPDTATAPWSCWRDRWWPVPIYRNPAAPALRDATTVWWDAQERRVLTSPPPEWSAFFGNNPSQPEHPHELAAVALTTEDTSSEAGRRIVSWWRTA